jgi:hypothetical protein
MTELSNLLKEAKPLYFARKKIKKRIQNTCTSLCIIFAIFISGFGGYALKSMDTLVSYEVNNNIESFIPIDDDGLITVAY